MAGSKQPFKPWWFKESIEVGTGCKVPHVESVCEVEIQYMCPDSSEIIPDTQITIGKPSSIFHVAIEQCLMTMRLGQVCYLDVKMQDCPYVLNSERSQQISRKLKIKLVSFTPGCHPYLLKNKKSVEISAAMKQEGVNYFKSGNHSLSFWYFSQALRLILTLKSYDMDDDDDVELEEKLHSLKLACYLNLSLYQLNNKSYYKVLHNCSKALELDSSNVKALYRRGTALTELQEFDEAGIDLKKALLLEPNNKQVDKQLKILDKKISEYNSKYKNSLHKMFN